MDFKGIDRWLTPDESVDLNNCDREPIHIPSLIQPHGAMLVLNDNDDVVQASANVDEMLGGIDVSGFLGAWRASSSLPEIQSGRAAVEMSLGGTTTCTISHRIDGVRVLEIEAIQRKTDIHLLNMVNRASKTLELAKTQDEAYQLLVEQIQLLTGYDRVLAYIFDSDGHGTVRASKTVAEMDDFLGLRFPATDIPKQARRLYALELTRQIVDVHYVPVPLVPNLNPLTQRPLNMAFCQLRSVSPIHVEYLKNMGVQASFSVSVVVDNELMALIACHHRTPRHMDFRVRQACELLGRLSSEKFARRAEEQRRAQRNRQFAAQVDLLCELGEAVKVDVNNRAWTLVQGFVESDALLVEFQGQQRVYGDAPNKLEVMWRLGSRLAHKKPSKNRSTIQMTALDIHAPPGGLLVVPIAESGWLGWYRCSEDEHIQWAGKPQAPKDKDLTPRHSFEVWRETISGQCRRWSDEDIEMAEILRRGLAARLGEVSDGNSFERAMLQLREYVLYLEESNQAMARINEDLRQFTHVASHDLRAPLRTIRSFLPLLRETLPDDLTNSEMDSWIGYIESAAETLHRLQEGLWAFSRVNREKDVASIDVGTLVERLTRSLAADLSEARVSVGVMPTITGVPGQVETLFRNLIDNAAKYRHPGRRLHIVIDARQDSAGWIFSVTDNGIGFPPEASERVFNLFSRVHTNKADGDGLGLALCRRIAHHHQGWIRASSIPDEGSTFEFHLRKPRSTHARSK